MIARTSAAHALTPTPTKRWWCYVHEKQLRCPAGHHIPRVSVIPEWGFLRCSKRDGPEHGRECGRWVFLFAIAGGRCVTAEVTWDEIDPMRELKTPAAVIEYLGIFPAHPCP